MLLLLLYFGRFSFSTRLTIYNENKNSESIPSSSMFRAPLSFEVTMRRACVRVYDVCVCARARTKARTRYYVS